MNTLSLRTETPVTVEFQTAAGWYRLSQRLIPSEVSRWVPPTATGLRIDGQEVRPLVTRPSLSDRMEAVLSQGRRAIVVGLIALAVSLSR